MLGLEPNDLLLVTLGIATLVFGLVSSSFHVRLPGATNQVKMSLPRWFGRLWFIGFGILLIYLGIR